MLSGSNSLIKVAMDVWAQALGISGVNFCPGIRFWELNFAQALGFWQFLTKECVIFDKRVKKLSTGILYEPQNICKSYFLHKISRTRFR